MIVNMVKKGNPKFMMNIPTLAPIPETNEETETCNECSILTGNS